MQVKKKSSAKTPSRRTKSSASSRTAKKRKAKKPKIVLSAKKVYLLSAVIIAVCAVSLMFSILTVPSDSSAKSEIAKKTTPAEIVQPLHSSQKPLTPSEQPLSKKPDRQPESKKETVPANKNTVHSQKSSSAATSVAKSATTEKSAHAGKSAGQEKTAHAEKTVSVAKSAPVEKPSPSQALASARPDKPDTHLQSPKPDRPEPKSPFTIPPAKNGARLVFVIDDAGLHPEYVKRYTALPFPIAIAVLPRLSHSKECAALVRAGYKELMLHQPMQAHAYPSGKIPDPGKGAILPDMSTAQVAATIKENLEEIGPGVKGFNNHEGSLITENAIKMGAVLEVATERGMYFLDSRTTSHSAVPQAALERDLPYIARFAPFLDNKIDRDAMLNELYKGLEVANRNGYAVIIGHVDKSANILPQLLTDIYPYLVQAGYRFAFPSELR